MVTNERCRLAVLFTIVIGLGTGLGAYAQAGASLSEQRRQFQFSEKVAYHPPCITGTDLETPNLAVEALVKQTNLDIKDYSILIYDDGDRRLVLFAHKDANPNAEGSDPKAPSFECEVAKSSKVPPCRPSM